VLECVGIDGLVAGIHHVIIEERRCIRGEFESFVAARRGDDGVGGGNGGDDVFDYALGKGVGYAFNAKFFGALEGGLVKPGDMIGVVGVHFEVTFHARPLENGGPFNAVRRLARDSRESTDWNGLTGSEHVERAFVAGGDFGDNDTGLPFEAFSAAVYEGLASVRIRPVNKTDKGCIDPATGFNGVQAADDTVEGHVKGEVFVLDGTEVRCDVNVGDARLDKVGCAGGFRLADIGAAKKKLPV
jgi:hypothetical protein